MKILSLLFTILLLVISFCTNAQVFSREYRALIQNENILEQKAYTYHGNLIDIPDVKTDLRYHIRIDRQKNEIHYRHFKGYHKKSKYDSSWNLLEEYSYNSDSILTSILKVEYGSDEKAIQSKFYLKPQFDTLDLKEPTSITDFIYDQDGNLIKTIGLRKEPRNHGRVQSNYTKVVCTYDQDNLLRIEESFKSFGDSSNFNLASTGYSHYTDENKLAYQIGISDKNRLEKSKRYFYTDAGELSKLEEYSYGKMQTVKEYKYKNDLLKETVLVTQLEDPWIEIDRYEYILKD